MTFATMSGDWVDPAPHESKFVTVNGVRLNYLDWGGQGPWLILLPGITWSPHHFDDLAPAFTDHYRVIAYARRCHGLSEVKWPCDAATITEDLRCLMDALGIERANLVGHSYGGTELTWMAGLHPRRVERIVYLDGGYDWADPLWKAAMEAWPFEMEVPESARRSLEAYFRYAKAGTDPKTVLGKWFEPVARESVIVQEDGTVRPRRDLADLEHLVRDMLGNPRRDYTKVHCPALAVYASEFFDSAHLLPAHRKKVREWDTKYLVPFRIESVERIRRELKGVRVETVPTDHAGIVITLTKPVAKLMRDFLAYSPPLPAH